MTYDKVRGQIFLTEVGFKRPGDNLHTLRGSVLERLAQFGVSILDDEAGIATCGESGEEILRGSRVYKIVKLCRPDRDKSLHRVKDKRQRGKNPRGLDTRLVFIFEKDWPLV